MRDRRARTQVDLRFAGFTWRNFRGHACWHVRDVQRQSVRIPYSERVTLRAGQVPPRVSAAARLKLETAAIAPCS